MYSIANDEPPDLRGLDPIVPGALATWVRRGLAKDPGRRFASGGAMLDALRALAAPWPGPQSDRRCVLTLGSFALAALSARTVPRPLAVDRCYCRGAPDPL